MTIPSILSAIAALGGVLLVVLLAGRGARMIRLARHGGVGRLRVQETLALDPRRRLHLVTCDGREVLLLTGVQDVVVGWLPGAAP
jgi:flagellar protein FliO/FliZ